MNDAGRVEGWRAGLGRPGFADRLAAGMHFSPLTEDHVAHAAYFRFPVYACGYNWLQSNLEAAETLARRIRHVIAANNSASYRCNKVILVTHSMGGLVARACSEISGMRESIAGIVHGVMPATGAAVAYKRVRAGTEGAAGWVIGGTAEKVTAVFANAPGALQLLPTREYGAGWLRLGRAWRGGSRVIARLPEADPYEESTSGVGPGGRWCERISLIQAPSTGTAAGPTMSRTSTWRPTSTGNWRAGSTRTPTASATENRRAAV